MVYSALARVFKWPAVYLWYKKYVEVRADLKARWNTDLPLLAIYFREEDRIVKYHNADNPNKKRKFNAGGKLDVCWQWNKGACSYGTKCKFPHKCDICDGAHPKIKCDAKKSSK